MIQSTAFPRVIMDPLMSYSLLYRMSYNLSLCLLACACVYPSIALSKRNRSKEGHCVNFEASLGRNRSKEGRYVNLQASLVRNRSKEGRCVTKSYHCSLFSSRIVTI